MTNVWYMSICRSSDVNLIITMKLFWSYLVWYNYFNIILLTIILCSNEAANFDPLGINSDLSSALNSSWENLVSLISQPFQSSSSTEKEKPGSSRGVAGFFLDLIFK